MLPNEELKKKNFKRGLNDGYFKAFDMFGQIPIGAEKYKDTEFLTEFKSYYKGIWIAMILTFFLTAGSMALAVLSFMFNHHTIGYFFIGIYFLTMSYMWVQSTIGVYKKWKGVE